MTMLAFHMQPNRLDQICGIDLDARAARAQATWPHVYRSRVHITQLHRECPKHAHKYKISLQTTIKDLIKDPYNGVHTNILKRGPESCQGFCNTPCAEESQLWLQQWLVHVRMGGMSLDLYCSNCRRRRVLLCSRFHAQVHLPSISLSQLQPGGPVFGTRRTTLVRWTMSNINLKQSICLNLGRGRRANFRPLQSSSYASDQFTFQRGASTSVCVMLSL